jgi:hypothetical protein
MTPSAQSDPLLARAGCWLLGCVSSALPTVLRPWGEAAVAEAAAVPQHERSQFVAGATLALLRMMARHVFIHAWADRSLLLGALAAGIILGWIDAVSATRNPLRVLIPLFSCVGGWIGPRGSWRLGVLIGLGVPIVASVYSVGPYRYDTGDAWFSLPPAVALAAAAGWIRRRLARG